MGLVTALILFSLLPYQNIVAEPERSNHCNTGETQDISKGRGRLIPTNFEAAHQRQLSNSIYILEIYVTYRMDLRVCCYGVTSITILF